MANAERRPFSERAAGIGEKVSLAVGVIGLIMLDAPVVALGTLGFLASYGVGHKFGKG